MAGRPSSSSAWPTGWTTWLALAGAALVHQAPTGFVLTRLYGREGVIHVIGNVLFALGALALLLVAVRVTRRSPDA